MALEVRLFQKLSQQLVMTPQLQQSIKLLQLSNLDLKDMVSQELQENPVLEEDPADNEGEQNHENRPSANREQETTEKIGSLDWQDYIESHSNATHGSLTAEASREEDEGLLSWESTLTRKDSLQDYLLWQIRLSDLTFHQEYIGLQIVGNLDEKGYLEISLEAIGQVTGATQEETEAVLNRIQLFDPIGVAARDLKECLMIQLENLGLGTSLAARIVSERLSDLEARRYERIARDFNVTIDEINVASQIIVTLEPKPARGFGDNVACTVIPDVTVKKVDDEYAIFLNDDGIPHLRVNSLYRKLVGKIGKEDFQARNFIEAKVRAATWLIKSIHWRQQTLYRVTESIFKFQREFLDHGVSHMRPLILKDVAEDIGMHESTVSRATANKYVESPQGIYELKFFFQSGLRKGDRGDMGSESVKEKIRTIISSENSGNPYSDQDLVKLLVKQAIYIARRTVAKYREAMGILPSSRRRKLHILR